MDPDEKEPTRLHRNPSSPAITNPSSGSGTPDPNLADVAGTLATDTIANAESHSSSSLNPNSVLDTPISRTGDEAVSDESMKVFLRIRPLVVVSPHKSKTKTFKPSNDKAAWPKLKPGRGEKPKPPEKRKTSCIEVCDPHSVAISPPSTLHRVKSEVYRGFSQVFSADSSQEEVYAKTLRPVVEDFISGKSGLLAASGPSGSGKTHTVFGSAREPGLVPRALRHIFDPTVVTQDGPKRSFYLSFFEIYVDHGKMEKLSDLSPDGGEIQLQQSGLKGLKELLITDYVEAEAMIARAMLRRNSAVTNSNSQSSRSQCIIRIRCTTDNVDGKFETQINEPVLTFVDLAGAEREKRTGNQGDRLLESNFINKTSMVFGLCLKSLLEHQKNPKKPLRKHFQSSLLTRYLRDYLEGKKRMALILTVRSAEEDYLDTSFLLRQASPYMEIKFLNKDETAQSKRHYETMVNALPEQSKRMKILCHTESMDNLRTSAHASDTCEGYPKKKVSAKPNKVPVSKVKELEEGCHKKVSAKPGKIPVSKVHGEIVGKTDSEKEREYNILLGVSKSIWSLLKEYNQKIKVLEKCNVELQNKISEQQSYCACQKEEAVEVASLPVHTNSETTSLSEDLFGHRSAAADAEGEIDVCKEIEKQLDKCNYGSDLLGGQRSTYPVCKGDMEVETKSCNSEPMPLPGHRLSAFCEAKQNEMVAEVQNGRLNNTRESEKKAHMCKTESEHPQDDSEGETDVFEDIEKQADVCSFPKEQTPIYLKCKGGTEMNSKLYSSEPMQSPGDQLSAFHESKEDERSGEVEDYRSTILNELEKKAHINEIQSDHPRDDCIGEIDVSSKIEKQAATCKTYSEWLQEQSSIYLKCTEMEVKSYNSESGEFLEDHLPDSNVAKQNETVREAENCRPTNMMELEKKAHVCRTGPEHPQDERIGNVSNYSSYQGRDLAKEDKEESCDKILKDSYEEMPKSSPDSKRDRKSTRKNVKQKKCINYDGRGNFDSASEPGKNLTRENSSVKTKPKRRLMPASSVLLRHVSNLDFKDDGGTMVGRSGRSPAVHDNTGATNASLLRLLRVDAHR